MGDTQGRPWRFVATCWAVLLLALAIARAQGWLDDDPQPPRDTGSTRRYMPATKADAGEGARAKRETGVVGHKVPGQRPSQGVIEGLVAEPPAAFPASKSGFVGFESQPAQTPPAPASTAAETP